LDFDLPANRPQRRCEAPRVNGGRIGVDLMKQRSELRA
jgi:hypothetical protein